MHLLMNHVENICDLVQCSEEKLAEILGNESLARQLYRFLHAEHIVAGAGASAPNASKSKTRLLDFKGVKRKRFN